MNNAGLEALLKSVDKLWLEHLHLSKKESDKTMTHKEAHMLCAGIYMDLSHKLQQLLAKKEGLPDELWMSGAF